MDPYVHRTSTENGIIVKELQNMVVLFDELEKAHEQVKQGLLTLFGEGYVQVQHTNDHTNIVTKYVFTKSLFTSTSNAYQAQIVQDFQRALTSSEIAEHFTELNAQDTRNPHKYSPELLGRLHIIPFNPIPRTQFPELVRRKLPSLLRNLHQKVGCKTLTISDPHLSPIIDYLSNTLYGNGTGIRRLLKYFDHVIYQNICEQAEVWGNFKNKEMAIIPLVEGLGITCKETLYKKVVTEYPPVPVRMT
jgi:ATP-dependent Clp protease ATP-binding subunit ClpA